MSQCVINYKRKNAYTVRTRHSNDNGEPIIVISFDAHRVELSRKLAEQLLDQLIESVTKSHLQDMKKVPK